MKKDNKEIVIAMIKAIIEETENMHKNDEEGKIGYRSVQSILSSVVASLHLGETVLMQHSKYNVIFANTVLQALTNPKKEDGEKNDTI